MKKFSLRSAILLALAFSTLLCGTILVANHKEKSMIKLRIPDDGALPKNAKDDLAISDWPAIAAAIETANHWQQEDGLDEALNTHIIDLQKAEAFVKALQKMSPEELKPLAGRSLWFFPAFLGISTASPTTPASFDAPFKFTDVENEGKDSVAAKIDIVPNCDLAVDKAGKARLAFAAADVEIERLETAVRANPAPGDAYDAFRGAGIRRYILALAWELNAGVVKACKPSAAADADYDAAKQASARTADTGTIVGPRHPHL